MKVKEVMALLSNQNPEAECVYEKDLVGTPPTVKEFRVTPSVATRIEYRKKEKGFPMVSTIVIWKGTNTFILPEDIINQIDLPVLMMSR